MYRCNNQNLDKSIFVEKKNSGMLLVSKFIYAADYFSIVPLTCINKPLWPGGGTTSHVQITYEVKKINKKQDG